MKEGVPKIIYRRKTETNFASKQKLKRVEENWKKIMERKKLNDFKTSIESKPNF